MEIVEVVMFVVLVVLCVFFIVCGIQFGRGKWLGLIVKQKPMVEKKHNNARRQERAKKRREEELLAVGAKLSYVMFAAAFASCLQILSQVLIGLNLQPFATIMFGVTVASYVGVFVLLFVTIRKIQGK